MRRGPCVCVQHGVRAALGAPLLLTFTEGVTFALSLLYANTLQVERRSVMLRQMAAEDAPEAAAAELKAKAEAHESQVRMRARNYFTIEVCDVPRTVARHDSRLMS